MFQLHEMVLEVDDFPFDFESEHIVNELLLLCHCGNSLIELGVLICLANYSVFCDL